MLVRAIKSALKRIRHYFILCNARSYSYEIVENLEKPQKILVLCYGNIYRSAFAGSYLQMIFNKLHFNVSINTAGFYNRTGRSSPAEFQGLALKYGVDLSKHTSKQLDENILNSSDMIIIMDRWNWDNLKEIDPALLAKTVWLGAFSDSTAEIHDPYNKTKEEAEKVIIKIIAGCERLATIFRES